MAKRLTLFVGSENINGTELWVTDGTTAGTHLLKDIYPGIPTSSPESLTALGDGRVVFSANDGIHGTELWVTDGTTAGTTLLKDIIPGSGGAFLGNLGGFTALGNGRAIFRASDTSSGTNEGHGVELWVTDGTTAGTTLLKDIYPGSPASFPNDFTALGDGRVLFTADDNAHGTELWVTDGTTAGTSLVKDIYPGNSILDPDPKYVTSLGDGRAVFAAFDATHGFEPWVTDGTAAGTFRLKDIYPEDNTSNPHNFVALGNGRAVFTANDLVHGTELWITDGSAVGTFLIKDINPGANSSWDTGFDSTNGRISALGNGKAVFQASNGSDGYELWVTDGTAAGTSLLKDIIPGSGSSSPIALGALGNGRVVFSANDGIHGTELWVTDGTTAGTSLVKDIHPFVSASSFIALGDGRAFFAAGGSDGNGLWVTDGTAAGTYLVKDTNPGGGFFPPRDLTAVFPPVIGTAGSDSLSGGAGDDVISGLGGSDTLTGGAGDDWLDGGTGNDVMKGGVGNDAYVMGSAGDVVTELAGQGTDTVQSSISYTLTANVERLTLTGSANISGTGNNLANLLTGNTGNNTLDGKAGADTMKGGLGNDTYIVGSAGDVVTELAGQGTDTVLSSISYTLTANVERLTLTGSANINGTGNTLANLLTGNTGNNTLDGNAGADTMKGSAGNDTYYVDNAGDQVGEGNGPGTDIVYSSVDFSLPAHVENLTLTGSALEATGNGLANVLTGNSRNNVLDGGLGNDTLTGGGGQDTFLFDTLLTANVDTVADFNVSNDKIRLDQSIFAAITTLGTLSAAAFFAGAAAHDSDDRIIYNSATGNLFYDRDGTGATAAVQFAHLNGAPSISNTSFNVVA